MNLNSLQSQKKLLIRIFKMAGLFLAASFALAGVLAPQQAVFSGLFFGALVAGSNFILLVKLISKVTLPGTQKGFGLVVLLLSKMFCLLGLTGIAFLIFKVEPMSFFFGFMTVIGAVVLAFTIKVD